MSVRPAIGTRRVRYRHRDLVASSRWLSVVSVAWIALSSRALAAPPVRILLAVGQDVGAAEDEPLRYAERDARRVAQLFTALGDVDPKRSYLLTDASADRVRQTLAEIRGRSIELGDAILIVYVSSHADSNGLHLGKSRLPYAELRALIASIPARLRLLITDACTSGALIRVKGGRPIKPFAIDLEGGHDIQGQVVITSTGPSEPAQEWEALGGSLFTHHLLSGLRGAADRNGDGRVTLFEAYSYSYDRTLAASTDASAGAQHPSHEIDLRGEGDLVLTRPGGRNSGLGLAAPLSGRYVVTSTLGGELIAEVDKVEGRPVRLALDPGRYLVRKPEGSFVRVGELLVLPSRLSMLDEADMEQVPYAEVARRGAGPTRAWAVELGLGAHAGVVTGAGMTPAVGAALLRERGPWAFAIGFELASVDFAAQQLSATQRELWGRLDTRLCWPVGWTLPYLGVSLGVGWIHQTFVRPEEGVIRDVFHVSGVPARDGLAGRLMLTAGLELPLSGRVSLRLEAGGGMTVVRAERGWSALPAVAAGLSGGFRF
jgi:hypothetical protein